MPTYNTCRSGESLSSGNSYHLQTLVYKDTWRDARRSHEGDVYKLVHTNEHGNYTQVDGIAAVHSYTDAYLHHQRDSTAEFIRRGLKKPKKHFDDNLSEGETLWVETTDPQEPPLFNEKVLRHMLYGRGDEPVIIRDRIHSRMVLSTVGCGLLGFASLPELFNTLHDAVLGSSHVTSFLMSLLTALVL